MSVHVQLHGVAGWLTLFFLLVGVGFAFYFTFDAGKSAAWRKLRKMTDAADLRRQTQADQ